MIPALLAQVVQRPPGAVQAPGDTLLHGLDTLAAAATSLRDTLSQAPLPGGVAAFVRFLFQVPQWIQKAGVVVAALVALAVAILLWRRRVALWTWWRTRSGPTVIVLASSAVLVLAVLLFGGMKSWNYMQHDNGFCTGCHIMERPFERFEAGAGKHDQLLCHDCHQQSIFASTRQLVLWVANRPQKIGPHALVPNSRCESCHQIPGGKKPFQHVLYLAGHKVHLDSDSASLQNLQCAKCHGAEIHRFVPSASACQQSGCHENKDIRLGKMRNLPAIKCTTCHAFIADIPALASHDSAIRALVPAAGECRSCHAMQGKPAGYVLADDPHKGSCGTCHDVHKDSLPRDAAPRCATCHAKDIDRSAFHTGANHKQIQSQCLTCHNPHAASLDASNCVGCHAAVQKRGLFHPPLPFDTAAVLRRKIGAVPALPLHDNVADAAPDHRGKGDALPEEPPPRASPAAGATPARDSFPHSRHSSLPCLTCHEVNNANRLVFEVPRGCDLCHHQSLMAGKVDASDCARCHDPAQLAVPRPMAVSVAFDGKPPVARAVDFRHDAHQKTPCGACHQSPNTVPPDSVRTCQACHDQHHASQRNCATCHNRPETPSAHSRTTHTACDDCHTPSRIAELVPSRTFCLVCHAAQQAHQPGGECTTCHFLATPAQFRPRLLKASAQ